ncbi:MAG TPA: hypothetical protein VGD48_35045, partial [Kutzneria sp.]
MLFDRVLARRSVLAGAAAIAAVPLLAPARAMADEPTIDWIQWLAQRRDHVSLYADDGRGRRLSLRPNHQVPMA